MRFSPKLLARARTPGSMRLMNAFPEFHAARRKLSGTTSEILNILTSEVAQHWQEPLNSVQYDRFPNSARTDELDIIYRHRLPARQAFEPLTLGETANLLKNSSFDLYGSMQSVATHWNVATIPETTDHLVTSSNEGFYGGRSLVVTPDGHSVYLYQEVDTFIPKQSTRNISIWYRGTGSISLYVAGRAVDNGTILQSVHTANLLANESSWTRLSGVVSFPSDIQEVKFYILITGSVIQIDAAMMSASSGANEWGPHFSDTPTFMLSEQLNNRQLWFIKNGNRLPIHWAGNFLDFFGLTVPTRATCYHEEDVQYDSVSATLGGKYDFWKRWWASSFKIVDNKIVRYNNEIPSEEHATYEVWDLKDDNEYAIATGLTLLKIAPMRGFLAALCREDKLDGTSVLTFRFLNPEITEPEMSYILTVHSVEIEDSEHLLDGDIIDIYTHYNDHDKLVIRMQYDSGHTLHHTIQFHFDYYWLNPEDPLDVVFRENYNPYGGVLFA